MKNLKQILLVIQITFCAVASVEQHFDAEISSDFVVEAIEAAKRRGMDGDAVAELLRTKKPVIKTVEQPNGVTKTITYKLESDGTISSRTLTETTISLSSFGINNWPGFDFTIRKPLPNIHDIYNSHSDKTINSKNPIFLNIEDLPITDILINGKPAGENIYLREMPTDRKLSTSP